MSLLVEAKNLTRVYRSKRGLFGEAQELRAVGGVSFSLEAGKTLAVVGESGCGKSTLARLVTLIEKPNSGTLMLDGADAIDTPAADKNRLRRTVQLVFQNPYGSLNPRKKVGAILEEPLIINTKLGKAERRQPGARHDGARRLERRICAALSAHVLRRPAPAHCHCPRADAAA